MAIALVKSASGNNGGGATSVAATLSSSPVAGNFLVACIAAGSGPPASSVTSTGASWSKATGVFTGTVGSEIWYAENVSTGGATITANFSGSPEATIIVGEFSGVLLSASVDRVANAAADYSGSTPADSGTTAATSQADEISIAGLMDKTLTGTWTTPTNSFTKLLEQKGGTSLNAVFAYKIVSVTGTQNTSVPRSPQPSSGPWVASIATFKAAAGGGGGGSTGLLGLLGAGK